MSGPSPFRALALAGILILALFGASPTTFAAPPLYPKAESTPKPTAPVIAPSAKKIPENPFKCDRLVKYRGKTLPCDSALRRDGESLRAIMENTPDAVEELDRYQSGRTSLKMAAYTGTAGVVLFLTSSLLANLWPEACHTQARNAIRWLGGGLTLGSIAFGISRIQSNEDHLQQSIQKYNAAHSDHPIEILFKTEF